MIERILGILRERIAADKSLRSVARSTGISAATLHRFMWNSADMRTSNLAQLVKHYGITEADILEDGKNGV